MDVDETQCFKHMYLQMKFILGIGSKIIGRNVNLFGVIQTTWKVGGNYCQFCTSMIH